MSILGVFLCLFQFEMVKLENKFGSFNVFTIILSYKLKNPIL